MNAEIINKCGEELFSIGDFLCAAEAFKKAIEIKPNFAVAHCNLAVFYHQTGNLKDALTNIEKAKKLEPDNRKVNANYLFISTQYEDFQRLPLDEQKIVIKEISNEAEENFKKYSKMNWHKDAYLIIQLRWMLFNTWVKNAPLYSAAKIQQSFITSIDEDNLKFINCPLCGCEHFNVFYPVTTPGYTAVQCTKCNFLYRNPTYGKKKLTDVYNKGYLKFLSGSYASGRKEMYRNNLKNINFEIMTQHFTRRRILDIGCGHGLFLTLAQELGWDSYGLDFAEDCISYARENFGLDKVAVGNLEDDSFEPEYFDVVTLWSVAAHLEEPLKMFNKINRILRPGGLLIIYTVDSSGLMHQLELSRWAGYHANHLIFFTPETLKTAMKLTGFAVAELKYDNRFLESTDLTEKVSTTDLEFFKELSEEINLGYMMTACAIKQRK